MTESNFSTNLVKKLSFAYCLQSDANSENFRIQFIIGWNYVNSCTSAGNHEAFPSTSHLDHEDDSDDDNDNHNHDNDDDIHDHDHDDDHDGDDRDHDHDDDDHGQTQVTSKRAPRQVDAAHFEPLTPHLLVGR